MLTQNDNSFVIVIFLFAVGSNYALLYGTCMHPQGYLWAIGNAIYVRVFSFHLQTPKNIIIVAVVISVGHGDVTEYSSKQRKFISFEFARTDEWNCVLRDRGSVCSNYIEIISEVSWGMRRDGHGPLTTSSLDDFFLPVHFHVYFTLFYLTTCWIIYHVIWATMRPFTISRRINVFSSRHF